MDAADEILIFDAIGDALRQGIHGYAAIGQHQGDECLPDVLQCPPIPTQ